LEIGFGTGLNLPHYPASIKKLTTADPSVGMQQLAQRRIAESGIEVDQRLLSGEELPFADASFDCVVSTFTLCSIERVEKAIAEASRVLAAGGRFLFLEHGLSPDAAVRKWQRRLNWLQKRLAGGCHLDRDIPRLVEKQTFSSVACEAFYLEYTPRTHGYLYRGCAFK
jgi:ubiquinone/menaquinone biosynthesis C-methylase UbiE